MESESVWVLNHGETDLEIVDMQSHKWYVFKPGRPQPIPRQFALTIVGRYSELRACDNPEKYFASDKKIKQLVIRDAGIGDLLLLEPLLRELTKTRDITIKTKYPEVYYGNPNIKTIRLEDKHDVSTFDMWDDLRNYSEIAPSRAQKHRTDVYNEILNVNVTDKEPRLYANKDDVCPIKKIDGFRYFIIQCDASHGYRKYPKGVELAEYIVSKDDRNVAVIIGSYDYLKFTTDNQRIIDLQGKTTIRQCISLIKDADYFIGGDSGLLHVACTLHTPSVGLFSIITPDLRMRYYKGPYKIITKNLPCIGCGNFHMDNCNFGNLKTNKKFVPPCMDIAPLEIYDALMGLEKCERVMYTGEKVEEKKVNIIMPTERLTMPIIVLNEEKNLPRFIEKVMSHPLIGRVVAIDGGSTDRTVELLKKAGAEVYIHPYLKGYHEMQAMQRNISFSYVHEGDRCLVMDIDECFSKDLSDGLYEFVGSSIEYALLSRRTFNYYADIDDIGKQIKDYPDWQPRYFKWSHKWKWFRSPHHILLNAPQPIKIQRDIIHFEKENKDRDLLESEWASMWGKTKEVFG